MPPSYHIDSISYPTFQDVLARYPSTVPDKLLHLDIQRYETIPSSLANGPQDGAAKLTKEMIETLVEWKLKHGTFRPKLLALVQSNDAETMFQRMKQAEHALPKVSSSSSSSSSPSSPSPSSSSSPPADVSAALTTLTQLHGVGPATASLLLSVLRPADVPFFSDELFRWCCWDEAGGAGAGAGAGWKRRIKYTAKEYGVLVDKVQALRSRLGRRHVQAVHVEKVAWVLGKEGVDVGDGHEASNKKATGNTKKRKADDDEDEDTPTPIQPTASPPSNKKKNKKNKTATKQEINLSAAEPPLRRSTRLKR